MRGIIICLSLVLVLALTLLAIFSGLGSRHELASGLIPADVKEQSSPQVRAVDSNDPLHERNALSTATPARVQDLLEAYWGMSIDELKRQHPGIQFDATILQQESILLPWKEIEPLVRSEFTSTDDEARKDRQDRWVSWPGMKSQPDYDDSRLNPGRKVLNSADKAQILRIDRGFRDLIVERADIAEQLLAAAIASDFEEHRFSRSPLIRDSENGANPPVGRGQYHTGMYTNRGGWIVDFEFDSSNHPELEASLQEMKNLRQERFEATRRYIESVP